MIARPIAHDVVEIELDDGQALQVWEINPGPGGPAWVIGPFAGRADAVEFVERAERSHATVICPTCGGSGKQPGEPQPDYFGNYTPCDTCEGTGKAAV